VGCKNTLSFSIHTNPYSVNSVFLRQPRRNVQNDALWLSSSDGPWFVSLHPCIARRLVLQLYVTCRYLKKVRSFVTDSTCSYVLLLDSKKMGRGNRRVGKTA
jgi:hypothetical protein